MANELASAVAQAPCPPPDDLSDSRLLEHFIHRRDEAAFAALMERHGPMVLGVCRRVLHDAQDAEDAFQATFLLLVRKAASLGRRDLVGNWLYGVAYRIAVRTRANAIRRRAHERQAMPMAAVEPLHEVVWRDLRPVLDAEINRLPEKYRAPLVLYYLEGKTVQETARQLGVPLSTAATRLVRARERLRKRLERRNLGVPMLVLTMVLSHQVAPAAVPATLAEATRSAALLAAGPAGIHQALLGYLRRMSPLMALALLLALGLLGLIGVVTQQALAGKPVDPTSLFRPGSGQGDSQPGQAHGCH
jgi:RNA polymerase sigma factor (sigma-70 family)